MSFGLQHDGIHAALRDLSRDHVHPTGGQGPTEVSRKEPVEASLQPTHCTNAGGSSPAVPWESHYNRHIPLMPGAAAEPSDVLQASLQLTASTLPGEICENHRLLVPNTSQDRHVFSAGREGGGGELKEKRVGGDVTASGALPSFTQAPLPCDTSGQLVARGQSSPGCSPAARWGVCHCSNSGAAHSVCHCSNSRGRSQRVSLQQQQGPSQRVSLQQQRGPLTACVTAATAGPLTACVTAATAGPLIHRRQAAERVSLHQRIGPSGQAPLACLQSAPSQSQPQSKSAPSQSQPQSKSAPVKVSPQSKTAPSLHTNHPLRCLAFVAQVSLHHRHDRQACRISAALGSVNHKADPVA